MERFSFKKKSDLEPIEEDEDEIKSSRTELQSSSGDNEISIHSHRDYQDSENEENNHLPLSPLSQSEFSMRNITKSTSPLGDKFNQFNSSTSLLPAFKKKTSLENNEEKTFKERQLLGNIHLSKKPKSELDLLSLTKNAKRTYSIPELLIHLKDEEKGIKRHVYLIPPVSSEDIPEAHHAFFESDYFTYMKKTLNYSTKESEIALNKLITKKLIQVLPKSQFGSKKRYSFTQSEFLNEKQKEDLNFNILQSFKAQNIWLYNFSDPFLQNKICSKYLRQNLISDFTLENLEFFIICQQYENTSSLEMRKELGKKIYSNFIDKGIINLNSDTIEDLDKIFDSYSVDIFKKAKEEIKYLIDSDCFPRFIYSKYFFKILKKMFKENV